MKISDQFGAYALLDDRQHKVEAREDGFHVTWSVTLLLTPDQYHEFLISND